jgi:hypothetical protein
MERGSNEETQHNFLLHRKWQKVPFYCSFIAICIYNFYNLRKTSRAITQFYDKMLEPSGLAITQFSLLVGLSIAQNPTITAMANEMIIDRTTLTRNLDIPQDHGLVKIKESSNDKGWQPQISIQWKEIVKLESPLFLYYVEKRS